VPAATLTEQLARVRGAAKSEVIRECDGVVEARVYADKAAGGGNLTREVADFAAQQKWQIDELHTEEGHLDEVFRSITLPDTVRGGGDMSWEAGPRLRDNGGSSR
jgi:ABC-2 type transport system ATP-binding protein